MNRAMQVRALRSFLLHFLVCVACGACVTLVQSNGCLLLTRVLQANQKVRWRWGDAALAYTLLRCDMAQLGPCVAIVLRAAHDCPQARPLLRLLMVQ